jgi:predicted SprT family Zn-dependent metalloprotease
MIDVREWIQTGLERAGEHITVIFEFNNRFTKRIGDAVYWGSRGYGRIRLSGKLWPTMSETEKIDTILHEVAHIIDQYRRYKGVQQAVSYRYQRSKKYGGGHGPEWHKIAKEIGAKPQRFADKDAADFAKFRRRTTRYSIPCNCGSCVVSSRMLTVMKKTDIHKGIIRRCRKCRRVLDPYRAKRI